MKFPKALILLAIFSFSILLPFAEIHAETVVSVTSTVPAITDFQRGQTFGITVTFSGPMDITADPTVILAPDLVTSGTLAFTGVSWAPDGKTYTIEYTVVDQNEMVASVDATIIGAIDAGIPATPVITYIETGLFSVDMLTPANPETVVSVVPSTAVINDTTANFSIDVTFSGPMDVTTDPLVALSPDLYTLGTLGFDSVTWSGTNNVYTINYTVNDLNEEIASVDASIIGALDAHVPSMPLLTYVASGLFAVDTKAPIATAGNITTTGATGNGGVFKIGDIVTVAWDSTSAGDNNGDIASATVDFSAFGGPASVAASNSGDIWTATYVLVEGSLDTVANLNPKLTATDDAGNAVTVGDDADVTVDNVKPAGYSVLINQQYINNANQTALAFTFAGAEVGATYNYDINGSVTGSGTIGLSNGMVTGIDVSSLPDGMLTLSVYLTDASGNAGNTVTALSKTKDTTLPTALVSVSDSSITLSDVGGTLDVTVTFSETMNMSNMPSITFSPNIVASGTLTASSFNWVDNKTYRVTYSIQGVSESQPTVDVVVSGGRDQYLNTMNAHTEVAVVTVDTVPVVVPTPTPSPTPSPSGGSTGGGGGIILQVNPNTNEIPGFVAPLPAPQVETPAPVSPISTFVDLFRPRTSIDTASTVAPTPEETTVISPDVAVVLEAEQPAPSFSNPQAAAAANGEGILNDLFSGSNIYLWLIILIALIVLGRTTVLLARKE